MARNKPIQYRTPYGIASYPRIDTADYKYNKDGNYKANVRLTLADAKETINAVQAIAEKHIGNKLKAKDNNCWVYDVDEDGNETGTVTFKMVVKNRTFKDKKTGEPRLWDRQPKVFTAAGSLVKKAPRIGAGTEYAVSFEVYEGKDNNGNPLVSLQPIAVQIRKLVKWEGNDQSAADFGFEAEEGGWSPDEDEDDTFGSDEVEEFPEEDGAAPKVEGEDDF